MRISSSTILLIAVVALFGCVHPKNASRATAANTTTIAEREILQQSQVKDSTDVVTFFRDGSVELTSGGNTVKGSLYRAMPEMSELTFPGANPGSPSRIITAWKRYDPSVSSLAYAYSNYTDLHYWSPK